jgi:hypothetical protein
MSDSAKNKCILKAPPMIFYDERNYHFWQWEKARLVIKVKDEIVIAKKGKTIFQAYPMIH